jgi:protein arginine kinase activator
MICPKCNANKATIRYREVIDGKVSEMQICPECYKAMQSGQSTGFEMAGTAPSARRRERLSRVAAKAQGAKTACRTCGTSASDLAERRRAGCPDCYTVFSGAVGKLIQRGTLPRHCGKSPKREDRQERLAYELMTLRSLLKLAVQNENYEEAAEHRDRIRSIESLLDAAHESGGSVADLDTAGAGIPRESLRHGAAPRGDGEQ